MPTDLINAIIRLRQAVTPYPSELNDQPGHTPARTRVVWRDDIAIVLKHIMAKQDDGK